MDISKISRFNMPMPQIQDKARGQDKNGGFGNMVHDFLSKVDEDGKNAKQQVENVLSNKSENIHDAMVALEEASLSFQLLLEVRTKMLDAYNEVRRTRV